MKLKFRILLLAGIYFFIHSFSFAAKYAVTPKYYDDMGAILDSLGYDYDEIKESKLSNYGNIKDYTTVFINCAGTSDSNATNEAKEAIEEYVENGGTVYAADWSYVFIENSFPDYVEFYSSPKPGIVQVAPGIVTDKGLKDYIDMSAIDIDYNLGAWVPIQDVDDKVDIYVKGASSSSDSYIKDKPLMVSFKYGDGRVVLTTFHNEAGLGDTAIKVLEYIVLLSITTRLSNELADYLQEMGYIVTKESFDAIDIGEEKTYTYVLSSGLSDQELAFGVNWDEPATYYVEVYGPDGSLVETSESSSPPMVVEAPALGAGTWTYKVTSKNAPKDNYPTVLMVGQRQPSANELENVRVYPNPFVPSLEQTTIVFDNLTEEADFKIFSISGELLAEFEKDNAGGYYFWDGKSGNDELGSGIYLYYISNGNGDYKRGKLAIIR